MTENIFTFNVAGTNMSLRTEDFFNLYPKSYLTNLVRICVARRQNSLYLQESPRVFAALHECMIAGPGCNLYCTDKEVTLLANKYNLQGYFCMSKCALLDDKQKLRVQNEQHTPGVLAFVLFDSMTTTRGEGFLEAFSDGKTLVTYDSSHSCRNGYSNTAFSVGFGINSLLFAIGYSFSKSKQKPGQIVLKIIYNSFFTEAVGLECECLQESYEACFLKPTDISAVCLFEWKRTASTPAAKPAEPIGILTDWTDTFPRLMSRDLMLEAIEEGLRPEIRAKTETISAVFPTEMLRQFLRTLAFAKKDLEGDTYILLVMPPKGVDRYYVVAFDISNDMPIWFQRIDL